jgi:hypothetical protein
MPRTKWRDPTRLRPPRSIRPNGTKKEGPACAGPSLHRSAGAILLQRTDPLSCIFPDGRKGLDFLVLLAIENVTNLFSERVGQVGGKGESRHCVLQALQT